MARVKSEVSDEIIDEVSSEEFVSSDEQVLVENSTGDFDTVFLSALDLQTVIQVGYVDNLRCFRNK
jgi:hypothetical protein